MPPLERVWQWLWWLQTTWLSTYLLPVFFAQTLQVLSCAFWITLLWVLWKALIWCDLIYKHANLNTLGAALSWTKRFSALECSVEQVLCFWYLLEPSISALLPSGSDYWSPVHRWGMLLSLQAELAQQGFQGWTSRDTKDKMRDIVPCSGTPFGLQLPYAWCQSLTG